METIVSLASAEPLISSMIKAIICDRPDTPPVAKTKPFLNAGVVKQAKPKANKAAEKVAIKKETR